MPTGSSGAFAMPTRFWVEGILFFSLSLCAHAQGQVRLSSGKAVTYSASGAQTVFFIPGADGRKSRLRVERDATVDTSAKPASVTLVGEIPGSALILIDAYQSIPGGMSYCQAGEERFLRVISISGKKPVETYRLKLESCRDNIELASPGLEWSAETRSLSIHWLSAPGKVGKAEDRTIKIGADGKPVS